MQAYRAPLRDLQFVLHELLEAGSPGWDRSTIDQTLEAAARFAEHELAPLNASGDLEGCRVAADGVKTPKGYAGAYRRYVEDGWPTLGCRQDLGGQAAPSVVSNAVLEFINAANPAWGMYGGPAHGAYECLLAHASPELKERYLPKIVSGEWTATMCLTEAHCGSDLGLLRTRAVPAGDGSYRVTGSKIFISGGDQDFTDNIVHLVLARLPDAPPGVRGISLFVVPKHLSERNPVTVTAVEHKMGLRGSATCAMSFDGAAGWLVGRANEGLRNMFVMMNAMRVHVAAQALGMAQAAYASALAYARERLQMRAAGGARRPDLPADPIIHHADVRRMLLTQKAHVEAGRMLVYWLSMLLDRDDAEAADLTTLLTPVAKAFMTENAFTVADLAIQIHGGHGYIRDHGVEQIARDVRISQIYEGTNGIQARDLLGRKVLGDAGASLNTFLARVRDEALPEEFSQPLARLCDELSQLTREIGDAARTEPDTVGAAGHDYLRALGHLVCGWLFARAAKLAQQRLDEGASDPLYAAKLATARFYFARLLPEASLHVTVARSGLRSLADLPEERLFL